MRAWIHELDSLLTARVYVLRELQVSFPSHLTTDADARAVVLQASLQQLADAEFRRPVDAGLVSIRRTRLGLMLLDGIGQKAAAAKLGVSERTAKRDARALRRVLTGRLLAAELDQAPNLDQDEL